MPVKLGCAKDARDLLRFVYLLEIDNNNEVAHDTLTLSQHELCGVSRDICAQENKMQLKYYSTTPVLAVA